MMDEGYKFAYYEDTDLMNKLFVNNFAFYFSKETKYIQVGTGWAPNTYNERYYKKKWKEDWKNNTIIQRREDKNKEDIHYYKGQFQERTYLTFDKSELLVDNVKNFYKDKKGFKNFNHNRSILNWRSRIHF